MQKFQISTEPCTFGFKENILIDLTKPIKHQLQRRRILIREGEDKGKPRSLKRIIVDNAALRIDFGWCFEISDFFETIMEECEDKVVPYFHVGTNNMISDMRCNWLGFVPYNIFEKELYENLTVDGLIVFNNELIDYQIAVVEFITSHKLYIQHAMLRDDKYRFEFFKNIRKDPELLADAYVYYMEAMHDVGLLPVLPRNILEEQIGCHFLYHPDLFFELLEFSVLKGEIDG